MLEILSMDTMSQPVAPAPVDLGTASDFAVMAGSGITNTGSTMITGDVGTYPTTSFTGFADVTLIGGSNQSLNTGAMVTARADLNAGYIDAMNRTPTTLLGTEFNTNVLTVPLAPGVYNASTSFTITGTLELSGLGFENPTWIFQVGSTLVTAAGSNMVLSNGAEACHIFWQVGSSATLGTDSEFSGTVMAAESITAGSGASVEGQLLADADLDEEGAVTLDNNAVEVADCEEEEPDPEEPDPEEEVPEEDVAEEEPEKEKSKKEKRPRRVKPKTVYRVVKVKRPSYATFAQTPNQMRVAQALDSWSEREDGDIGEVVRALNILGPEGLPFAFEIIMPSFYAGALATNLELSQSQNQLLFQQMSTRRLGFPGAPEPRAEFPSETIDSKSDQNFLGYSKNASSGKTVMDSKTVMEPEWQEFSMADSRRWNAWIQGTGFFSEGGMSLVPGETFESGMLAVGLDYTVNKHVTVGLFTSYLDGRGKFDNGARMDLETVRLGVNASLDFDGFYLSAAAGVGKNDYDVKRPIQWPTMDRTAYGSTEGTEYFGVLGTGYDFHAGNFTFGPSASLQYTKVTMDEFTETGADSLNLRVRDTEQESLRSYLGGRIAYTHRVNHVITLIPECRAFWQHEFLQNAQTIQSSLDGGNGPAFDYVTEEPGKDAFYAGAGVTALVGDRLGFSAFYHSNFASNDIRQQTVSITVGWRF